MSLFDILAKLPGAAKGAADGLTAGAKIITEGGAALGEPILPEEAGLPPALVLLRRGVNALGKVGEHGSAAAQGFTKVAEPFRREAPPEGAQPPPKARHKGKGNSDVDGGL